MSLHAKLSFAAQEKLRAQRRKSTISSIIIAALAIVLIGLILGTFLLPTMVLETPTIVTYESDLNEESKLETKKVTRLDLKPRAPSASMAKVISANTTSPTSIPVPDMDVTTPSLDFGDGDDFGDGWGSGDGFGAGGGGLFGSTAGPGLTGTFYDLKQKPNGEPTEMAIQGFEMSGAFDINAPVNFKYDDRLGSAIRRNLDGSALSEFFRAPRQLRLPQLYVPRILAEEAPKEFEIDSKVRGRRWVISYHGAVIPPERGRFRFAGFSDDVLVVLVNDRVVLDGSLASPLSGADRRKSYHQTHTVDGWQTYIGKWFDVSAGQSVNLKILIGERPGGHYSGYLLIEKQGLDYQRDSNGSPTLPLFKMVPSGMPGRGETLPDLAPDTSWSVWPSRA